jgi:hypothetical protein
MRNFTFGDVKLLPAFSKPYPDELLSSWIARLSFDHGLGFTSFLKIVGGIINCRNFNADFCDHDILRILSLYTNCSFEEVKSASLHCYENAFFENVSQPQQVLAAWTFLRFSRENSQNKLGLMFCPKCLSKPGKPVYFRKQWRLGISFVCLDCKCYLMDGCPHCENVVSFSKPFDPKVNISEYLKTCKYCKKDISNCQMFSAPEELVNLQKELYKVLHHGYEGKGIYPVSYFKVLRRVAALFSQVKYDHVVMTPQEQELYPFIQDVIDDHQHSFPFLHKYLNERTVQRSSAFRRAYKIMLGHWLLEEWPTRFFYYFRRSNLNRTNILLRCDRNATPFWFWETVYSNLLPPIPSIGKIPFGLRKIFRKEPFKRKQYKPKKKYKRREPSHQSI